MFSGGVEINIGLNWVKLYDKKINPGTEIM